MRNYFTFAGKDCREFNLYVNGHRTFDSPEKDYSMIQVPGRNGDVAMDGNRLSNIELHYDSSFIFEDFEESFSNLKNFLLSQRGYQRLIDTYHPNEYRLAIFRKAIEPTMNESNEVGAFDLVFECQPQRYLLSGEVIDEMDVSDPPGETITDDIVEIDNPDNNLAIFDLKADIRHAKASDGTISGYSSANIVVSPTQDASDGNAYEVQFNKTVYDGKIDIDSGILTDESDFISSYDPSSIPSNFSEIVEENTEITDATPGDIVSFNCELGEYPIKKLAVAINPVQDLHGYDNPWPAGGGKNKLDSSFCLNRTAKGIKSVVNADGSITLTGTSDGTARYWNSRDTLRLVLPVGTYTLSEHLRLEISGGGTYSGTFSLLEETTFQNVQIMGFSNGETVNVTLYPQLEAGSTATTYSPYSNICPISGWDSVTVNRTWKNLCYKVLPYLSTLFGDGNKYSKILNAPGISACFKCVEGETYIVSGATGRNRCIVAYFDSDPELDSQSVYPNTTAVTAFADGFSFTAEHTAYALCYLANTTLSDVNIQIELGSTATAYEPYNGNEYTIQLGGTVYGGTLDVTNGTMTVEWGMFTYNGSEDGWNAYQASQYGVAYFRNMGFYNEWAATDLPGEAVVNSYFSSNMGKLHAYQWIDGNSSTPGQYGLAIGYGLRAALNGLTPADITLAQWKTWLASNPIQLLAKLKTPVTITLDPVTISTISGQTNNVWCDAGEITELKYYDGDVNEFEGVDTSEGALVSGSQILYPKDTPVVTNLTPLTFPLLEGKNYVFTNTGDTTLRYAEPFSIENPTLFDSEPLIRVYGTGRVGIGEYTIVIDEADGYTDIDCHMMDCYKGNQNRNNYVTLSNHEFPVLKPGKNIVTMGTGISKVEITPRWWKV